MIDDPRLHVKIDIDLNPIVNFCREIVTYFTELAEVLQCPDAANHDHYAELVNSWPNSYIGNGYAMLKIPHEHICKTRMIIDTFA